MVKGLIAPEAQLRLPESPDFQNNVAEGEVLAVGLDRRQTFYVYAELLKPGKGSRQVREVQKLKTVTRRYLTAESAEETQRRAARAADKALEAAVEIAFEHLYRLRAEKTPFNRVFISTQGDTGAAGKDPARLDYFWPK